MTPKGSTFSLSLCVHVGLKLRKDQLSNAIGKRKCHAVISHTPHTGHFTAQTTLTRALLDLRKCPLTSMAQSNKQAQTLISVSLPTPTCSRCSRTAGDGSKGGIQSALYGVPCGRAPVLVPHCTAGRWPKSACGGGGGVGTRPWWLALLACGGAYWPLALEPSAMTTRHPHYCGHPHCRGHPPSWVGIQNATSAHGVLP